MVVACYVAAGFTFGTVTAGGPVKNWPKGRELLFGENGPHSFLFRSASSFRIPFVKTSKTKHKKARNE